MPPLTASMVSTMRKPIRSPSMNQLNTAANIGMDARIRTTFATLVSLTAKTNRIPVSATIPP